MIARIKPRNGRTFYAGIEPVTYRATFTANGGAENCQFAALIHAGMKDYLRLAEVEVIGHNGPAWSGVVKAAKENVKGSMSFVCIGHQFVTSFDAAPAMYLDTTLNTWRERLIDTRTTDLFTMQIDDGGLRMLLKADTTITAGMHNGFFRYIPVTDESRMTFEWERPNTNWEMRLFSGTISDANASREGQEWGAFASYEWIQVAGAGSTTGSETIDISKANHAGFVFYIECKTTYIPGSVQQLLFDNIKIYGVEDEAGGAAVTTVTPKTILDDQADKLPTDWLPAGSVYRSFIEDVGVAFQNFALENANTRLSNIMDHIIRSNDLVYMWDKRLVGASWVSVPILKAWPADPEYLLSIDYTETSPNIAGYDVDPLASKVLVQWEDQNNRPRANTSTSTTKGTYLVDQGITKTRSKQLDTRSNSTANTVATRLLDEWDEDPIKGTVPSFTLRRINGAPISHYNIRPGVRVKVLGIDGTDRIVRLTRVEQTATGANITLDNEGDTLEAALARIA